MTDFEKMGKEFMSGTKGEAIKKIAESPEGQKISKMVDTKAVEKAAKAGDMDALRSVLAQVLSTDEGKKLAQKLSETWGKK